MSSPPLHTSVPPRGARRPRGPRRRAAQPPPSTQSLGRPHRPKRLARPIGLEPRRPIGQEPQLPDRPKRLARPIDPEPRPPDRPKRLAARSAQSLARPVAQSFARLASDPEPQPSPAVGRPATLPPAPTARNPVGYASDRLYWCRRRSRQGAIGGAGVPDRSPRLSKCPVPDPPRTARRAAARQPQASQRCKPQVRRARALVATKSRALEPLGPQRPQRAHGPL